MGEVRKRCRIGFLMIAVLIAILESVVAISPPMTILFPVLGAAFAAFCVWLTVRIVNRRERWAKWTAIMTCLALTLYPLSFGPACWLAGDNQTAMEVILYVYCPILLIAHAERPPVNMGRIDRWTKWYSTSFRSDGAWPLLTSYGELVWNRP